MLTWQHWHVCLSMLSKAWLQCQLLFRAKICLVWNSAEREGQEYNELLGIIVNPLSPLPKTEGCRTVSICWEVCIRWKNGYIGYPSLVLLTIIIFIISETDTLIVLSHDPVMMQLYVGALIQCTVRTGASCAATCTFWLLPRSQQWTLLSALAIYTWRIPVNWCN